MRYLVSCECGRALPAGAGQAGQAISCTCGRIVKVPELRELRRMPVAAEHEGPPPQAFRWGAREVVFFVGVLLTATVLATTAVLAVGRSRLQIHWTEEAQAEVDSQVIDSLGVDEIYTAWNDMRREGLGAQQPHRHMFDQADAAQLSKWIRRLLLVAAPVGGLTMGLGLRLWLDRRGTST